MYKLSRRSWGNLIGVHPELSFVVAEAIKITDIDFAVIEGVRTMKRQRELVASGQSWTTDSYHLYGLAIDLVPYVNGKLSWNIAHCKQLLLAVKSVAEAHNIPVQNGGELWGKDWVHYQLTGYKNKFDIRKMRNTQLCRIIGLE